MKKKIFINIIAFMLAFVFMFAVACGNNDKPDNSGDPGNSGNTDDGKEPGNTDDGKEPGNTAEYTVTFDAGSGTVSPSSVKAKSGEKIDEPTASYKGYTLEGWYEESGYTTKWDFAASTVSKSVTLYAKWTANVYTVTLDVNGGNALQNNKQSVTYGQAFNLGVPTKASSNFEGWTYNDKVITDRNGKGSSVWNIDDDVIVKAKWSAGATSGTDDVTELEAAIVGMGHNYTTSVYYDKGATWDYDGICTEDGYYEKHTSEYASKGFKFSLSDDVVYSFYVRGGICTISQEPYAKSDGSFYSVNEIYSLYYPVSAIDTNAYLNQGNGIYACRSEYLYEQGSALLGKVGYPSAILITVTGDKITTIDISNFYDEGTESEDSYAIDFTSIGSSSIDAYLNTTKPPVNTQLPSSTDPSKPQAPASYTRSDEVKPVDDVPASAYVNGNNDNALPELKAAIEAAREKIRYNFEEYFDDTYFKGTTYWDPSSYYYISQFDGYKAYVARAYENYVPFNANYVVMSGGKVYRIDDINGDIKYVERDSSYDERTLGGNIFFKLNASMFEQSPTNPNVYTAKSEYLDAVCEVLFYCAREPDSWDFDYKKDHMPTIVNKWVSVTLNNGKFVSIDAERGFSFNDGLDDIQQMKFSFDYNTKLVMPYEKQFSADQLALKDAIAKTGSNYTLDLQYYDGWQIIEYYADNGIWKWYVDNLWGSSGYVYINDYAYFFDIDTQNGNSIVVDDEIYDWFDGPAETDGKYFRAWMNIYYLPLAQLDPRDFNRTGEKVFELKSSALDKYDGLFFDFSEENGLASMKIFLDDYGRIEKIECYNNYMGTDSAYASVVYVGDIGTTEIVFLF